MQFTLLLFPDIFRTTPFFSCKRLSDGRIVTKLSLSLPAAATQQQQQLQAIFKTATLCWRRDRKRRGGASERMREQARRKGFGARGGAGGGLSLSLSLSHAKTRCRGSRVSCPRFFLALSFFLPSLLSLSLSHSVLFASFVSLECRLRGRWTEPTKNGATVSSLFLFPLEKVDKTAAESL